MSYYLKLTLLWKQGGGGLGSVKVRINHNNFTNSSWLCFCQDPNVIPCGKLITNLTLSYGNL